MLYSLRENAQYLWYMSHTQIIVCGSVAVDRIFSFNDSFSEKIDSKKLDIISISLLMDRYDIVDGGTGANIVFNCAQLGLTPILLGSIGEDGKGYKEKLEAYGVDTSFMNISSFPTATFTVLSDKNGNQIAGFYPGAMADSDSLNLHQWKGKDVIVCISAHDPVAMKRQVAECVKDKIRLVYDPGQQVNNVSGEDLLEGCKAAEIILVNEYEFGVLQKKTGLSADQLKAMPKYFIMTKGKNGSTIEGNKTSEAINIPAAKPVTVLDPTGAGDAYRGGLLYGLAHSWDIVEAARLGSVVASYNVEISGHTQNFTTSDIEKRFKETFNKTIAL